MQRQTLERSKIESVPLVTIIMVCYNKFEYIYEALDSVFMQDYPNYELIVADDGSENFPKEEIMEYINKYATANVKRVLVYSNEENIGTVKNLNRAIQKSKGRYILDLGADDAYADEDVVSSVVETFQKNNALVVTSKKEIVTEDGIRTGGGGLPDENTQHKIESMSPDELYLEMWKGLSIAGAGTYYDRRCFEDHKLFDERFFLAEDRPTYLYLLKKQHRIHFLDKTTYLYRLGGVSTSKPWPQAIVNDLLNVYHYLGYPEMKEYIHGLIDLEKKQVIYGTGSESSRILAVLDREEIEPLCYMVSDGFSTETVTKSFPAYQISDFPYEKEKVQILVSEIQTDAAAIVHNLESEAWNVAVVSDLALSITWFYYMMK